MENKDLEKAICMWFNMKYELYGKIVRNDSIYLYHEGEEYADILVDKKTKFIYYKWYFWEEFSEIFPLKRDEFKDVISKWVEDTFNLEGFIPPADFFNLPYQLKIPNYKQN